MIFAILILDSVVSLNTFKIAEPIEFLKMLFAVELNTHIHIR